MQKVTGGFLPETIDRSVVVRSAMFHPPLPLPPIGFSSVYKFDKVILILNLSSSILDIIRNIGFFFNSLDLFPKALR